VFQGNRCRHRKTKCDGARPYCGPCAGSGQDCFYVADADATPIIAQKRRNEVLQQRCNEQLGFLEALVSVSEIDALMLLGRFRSGEEIPSLLVVAAHMPKVHKVPGTFSASQNQQPRSWSPVTAEFEQFRRNVSPVSLGASASSSLPVFEPRIDVNPTHPDPFRW
jgi:hypothetical protein